MFYCDLKFQIIVYIYVQFRNAKLAQMGLKMPSFRKTGTTIVGVTTKDCVILAADTRATSDTIVMEKNCEKIHYIGKYMQYVN